MLTSRTRAHLALVMVISALTAFMAVIYNGREGARPRNSQQFVVQPSTEAPNTAIAFSSTSVRFGK